MTVGILGSTTSVLTAKADPAEGPTIYVGSNDENLYAIDAETGEPRWVFTEASNWIRSSPIVVDGTLYVGSENDGGLYAVDAETGEMEWMFSASVGFQASPTVVQNTVYVAGGEGIYAIDAETGSQIWVYDTDAILQSSPLVSDGRIFVGIDNPSVDGEPQEPFLLALDAETGELAWEFTDATGGIRLSPTVSDGTIYVGQGVHNGGSGPFGGSDHVLYAIDADSGNLEWEFETDGRPSTAAPVVNETVYIGTTKVDEEDENGSSTIGILHAIDATTGTEEWKYEAPVNIKGSPTIRNNTVYFGGLNLTALNTATGEVKWETFEGMPRSSPTIVDDTVFVGTDNEKLIAANAQTGAVEWIFDDISSYVVSSPTVVANPSTGHSIDSRIALSTLNHHDREIQSVTINHPEGTGPAATDSGDSSSSGDGGSNSDVASTEPTEGTSSTVSGSTEENTDFTDLTTVFRRFSDVSDSSIIQAIAGVGSVGLVYGAYRTLNNDSGGSTPTAESLNPRESSPVSNAPKTKTGIVEMTEVAYSDVKEGEIIESNGYATIWDATVESHPVWFLMPPQQGGETIPRPVYDHFMERVEPWIEIEEHPNILSIYQSGEQPVPWVIVERGDYTPIAVRDERTEQQVQKIIGGVCEAIHHVSRYGILYNGLTTDSILSDGGNSVALRGLLDQFGDTNLWYAAPEEHDGDATERTLVYRVGLSTYELLTGSLPYVGYPDTDPTESINNGVQLHASEAFNELDPDLQETLSRALAPSPTDRHETVLHLRDELNQGSQ